MRQVGNLCAEGFIAGTLESVGQTTKPAEFTLMMRLNSDRVLRAAAREFIGYEQVYSEDSTSKPHS